MDPKFISSLKELTTTMDMMDHVAEALLKDRVVYIARNTDGISHVSLEESDYNEITLEVMSLTYQLFEYEEAKRLSAAIDMITALVIKTFIDARKKQ